MVGHVDDLDGPLSVARIKSGTASLPVLFEAGWRRGVRSATRRAGFQALNRPGDTLNARVPEWYGRLAVERGFERFPSLPELLDGEPGNVPSRG